MDALEASIGASPKFYIYSGPRPTNCVAPSTGTRLVNITCPSDWAVTSSGVMYKSGTWSGTAIATGIAGYYRMFTSGETRCVMQGDISQGFAILTSAATAANGNVLTFAATTGVTVGMGVGGVGIPTGTTVLAVTSTAVTCSASIPGGVLITASISFGDFSGNLLLGNTSISTGQTVTIDAMQITCPGA